MDNNKNKRDGMFGICKRLVKPGGRLILSFFLVATLIISAAPVWGTEGSADIADGSEAVSEAGGYGEGSETDTATGYGDGSETGTATEDGDGSETGTATEDGDGAETDTATEDGDGSGEGIVPEDAGSAETETGIAPLGTELLPMDGDGQTIDLNDREKTGGTGWSIDEGEYVITGDVTVIGTVTGARRTLCINLQSGASVDWAAEYTGSVSDAYDGLLEVKGSGVFNIAPGGIIRNNGDGDALCISTSNVNIIINGGTLAAAEGFAIRAEGHIDVTVKGGFVFAYGKSVADDVFGFEGTDSTYTLSGNGVIVCWDDANPGPYEEGGNTGLTPSAGATALWHFDAEMGRGVSYGHEGGSNAGFFVLIDSGETEAGMPEILSIAPSHAILSNNDDVAILEVDFSRADAEYSDVEWAAFPEGAVSFGNPPALVGAGKAVTVRAESLEAQTVLIAAVYDDGGVTYTATATIELLPGGITPGTTIKLLEKNVTVNTVKEVGALVPVLITQQPPESFGLSTFSLDGRAFPTGSNVVREIKLFTQNIVTKEWTVEVNAFEAKVYEADSRYIRIDATDVKARVSGNVKVMVYPSVEGAAPVDAGTITIKTVEQYPILRLKPENLNLAFPKKTASITPICRDGAVTILDVKPCKQADSWKVVYNKETGALELGDLNQGNGAIIKRGNIALEADIEVAGYKVAGKTKPRFNVKIVDLLPRLKLSSNSVALLPLEAGGQNAEGYPAELMLVAMGSGHIFEDGYEIEDVVSIAKNDKGQAYKQVDAKYKGGGLIEVRTPGEQTVKGKALLKVTFAEATKPLYMTLKVTAVSGVDKIMVKPQVNAATVNTKHEDIAPGNKILDVRILLNAANFVADDWRIINVKRGKLEVDKAVFEEAVKLTPGANKATLSVANNCKLGELYINNKDTKYTLKIGSDKITDKYGDPKSVTFTLTVSEKKPGFDISLGKDRIDVTKPDTATTAKVTLNNTTAEIESVELFDSVSGKAPDLEKPSEKFEAPAGDIGVKSFKIVASRGGGAVPKAKQKLSVKITLKNGQELTSWTTNEKTGKTTDKPITVTPKQTTSKGASSSKAVTLYRLMPMKGETIGLELNKSAVMKLGAARVNEASVKKLKFKTGGFELNRAGENDWTLSFKDGKAPTLKGDKALKANSSYNISLELWAEGTYALDAGGKPIALQYKDPKTKKTIKTKPTLVKIKVYVK